VPQHRCDHDLRFWIGRGPCRSLR